MIFKNSLVFQNQKFYYKKTGILRAQKEIDTLIQEAIANNQIITYEAMNPYEKGPKKFYGLFKVHKKHIVGTPPPLRQDKIGLR